MSLGHTEMAQKNFDGKETEKPIVAKSAVDLQRLKLMKLMKNPDKPILLPERPKSKNTPAVPEFVRNVMGSSAGAGSGEFHVYRHLRRKEYSRQKFIQEKGKRELLDEEYHKKLEENKKAADKVTAKKRAKRLKRKQMQKQKRNKKSKVTNIENSQSGKSDTSDGELEAERRTDAGGDRVGEAGSLKDGTCELAEGVEVKQNSEMEVRMEAGIDKSNGDND